MLVLRARAGEIDEIFIGYSGHGTRREDLDGDETDENQTGRGYVARF